MCHPKLHGIDAGPPSSSKSGNTAFRGMSTVEKESTGTFKLPFTTHSMVVTCIYIVTSTSSEVWHWTKQAAFSLLFQQNTINSDKVERSVPNLTMHGNMPHLSQNLSRQEEGSPPQQNLSLSDFVNALRNVPDPSTNHQGLLLQMVLKPGSGKLSSDKGIRLLVMLHTTGFSYLKKLLMLTQTLGN